MIKLKIIKCLVIAISLLIIIPFVFVIITIVFGVKSENYSRIDNNINDDYIDSYKCQYGLRDNITYEVYYYDEDKNTNMIKHHDHIIVNEDNIEELKDLFKNIEMAINRTECKTKYDVSNIDNITYGDYFYLERPDEYYEAIKNGCKEKVPYYCGENKYTIYYYDVENHTLFYVKSFNF